MLLNHSRLLRKAELVPRTLNIGARLFATGGSGREIPKLMRSQSFKIDPNNDTAFKRHNQTSGSSEHKATSTEKKTVVITGAAGNLGQKAIKKLLSLKDQKFKLVLMGHGPCPDSLKLDEQAKNGNDVEYVMCDISKYDKSWTEKIHGAFACIMFAAQHPQPDASPIDAFKSMMINSNLLEASADGHVDRVVFASSNHVMGGALHEKGTIESNARPSIGTKFKVPGISMDSTLYASAKAAAEAQIKAMTDSGRLNRAIIARIGFCQPGENPKDSLPRTGNPRQSPGESDKTSVSQSDEHEEALIKEWWKGMYLSNDDLQNLIERTVADDLSKNPKKVMYVNGVSKNAGSRWSLDNDICFQPQTST